MKAKLLISSLLLGTVILALAKGDPVLMTINGKKIKLSEFEYLYNKNNQQQVEKETLEQYLDRFVLYKQKVADAEAAGLDTTRAFKAEFEGYQKDLAAPYMVKDSTYEHEMLNEAYSRLQREIDIDHMMFPLGNTPEETDVNLARMDSLRNCVLAGEDWEQLANNFSSDPSKSRNHGHYGYVSAATFPYEFENVVYSTAVGEVSKPFKTQFGVHMIRVNNTRERNDVHAKHIIKVFPKNATAEQKAHCKQQIDSIYDLLQAGANFEDLARTESQDGSARRGGDLGWFGHGRMIPAFEQVAFDLADGEISKPFETDFGYHIVKKVAHGIPSFQEVRPALETAIKRDIRATLIHERRLNDLKKKYNYRFNPDVEGYLTTALNKAGGYDSTFVPKVIKMASIPLFTYGDSQSMPLSGLTSLLNVKSLITDDAAAREYILSKVDALAEKTLTEYNERELVKSNPEYRNLLNEYRDGMLLFEISNNRVWKAANRDTVGLEQYFEAHRDNYRWNEPHFKGIILSASNDSVMQLVKADIPKYGTDTLPNMLHLKYGADIRMERMVVKQGENALADYLAFGVGDKPDRKNFTEFIVLEGGLISQPQDMSDVRGAVTSDYQDVLERQWKEELAKKYPAKINKKVLKKLK